MATCPKCLTETPDDVHACVGCGRPRFAAGLPVQTMQIRAAGPVDAWPGPGQDQAAPATVMLSPASSPGPRAEPARPSLTPPPPGPSTRLDVDGARPPATAPGHGNGIGRPYGDRPPVDPATPTVCLTAAGTPPPGAEPTPTPPPAVRLKFCVIRGQRMGQEFPVYPGRNTVGRFADKPVDIDLNAQEAEGQVWSSRQHAAVTFDKGVVAIEDLNSLNGTWLNGARISPGQQRLLKPGDVVQIGTVQIKLMQI